MREWITGRNPVYEVLRANRRQVFRLQIAQGVQEKGRLAEILQMAKGRKLPVEQVRRELLERQSSGNQGVALEVSGYPYRALPDMLDRAAENSEPPFLLLLDTLQDPQNLGTLLRTADAVGVHGVLIPFKRTVTVTPAVVHASSGASEHLMIGQANLSQTITALKEKDIWVVGLEGGPQAEDLGRVRLDGPLALVVGSEGEGMRDLVRSSCDVLLRLPMRGHVASLNASTAGSIALYMAWQARQYLGVKGE